MNNRKLMVIIKVDENAKVEFESLQEIHGQSFADALEAGMEAAIFLAQLPKTIKYKIRQHEVELHNLRKQLEIATDPEKNKSDFRWG